MNTNLILCDPSYKLTYTIYLLKKKKKKNYTIFSQVYLSIVLDKYRYKNIILYIVKSSFLVH